ncbi:hypothetical protein Pgin04_01696 [Porphyromonas gingivalis]
MYTLNTIIPPIFPADSFAPIAYHAISIFGQIV